MVKYLTYEENKYPIRVSYYALKMLKADLGRSLGADDDGTDYEAYETLLFYALKKGHQKTLSDKPFTFKKTDMEDVMDEVYFDFIKIVPEFFSDANLDGELKKEGAGKITRKK